MSTNQLRLEVRVDVFEKTNQRAIALSNLTPPQLIEAILQEFRELEYLGTVPTDYQLRKAQDRSSLADDQPLGEQLQTGERLLLVENGVPLPAGVKPPSQPAYLREQTTGRVYKLNWLPAIIGRPDKSQPGNEQIAVDLEGYKTGLRVSRRQAQITEENGQFFIESLSGNPTAIKNGDGTGGTPISNKHPLHHGDIIFLERSNIALKFIIRPHKTSIKES
jgi:hypothetical protein